MKLAICTCDYLFPVQESIRKGGHEVVKIWSSVPLESPLIYRTKLFAEEMGADIVVGRVTDEELQKLERSGVELLLSAAYGHKIPTPENSTIKFINTHLSLLPEGRGPCPLQWILLKYPQFAGITFHAMTQKLDSGDIVLQRQIELSDSEDMNSLVGKTSLLLEQLSTELLSNFHVLWNNRRPMEGKGSYWKMPSEADRNIQWANGIEHIRKLFRTFGTYTLFDDTEKNCKERVRELSAWKATHDYEPGTLVTLSTSRIVIAASDGFVCLTPFSLDN